MLPSQLLATGVFNPEKWTKVVLLSICRCLTWRALSGIEMLKQTQARKLVMLSCWMKTFWRWFGTILCTSVPIAKLCWKPPYTVIPSSSPAISSLTIHCWWVVMIPTMSWLLGSLVGCLLYFLAVRWWNGLGVHSTPRTVPPPERCVSGSLVFSLVEYHPHPLQVFRVEAGSLLSRSCIVSD